MPEESVASVSNLRLAYAEVASERIDRQAVFRQLLKSIQYCEQEGSLAWSATLLATGFRMNVGQVEALTCTYSCMEAGVFDIPHDIAFFDFRLLISGPGAEQFIRDLNGDCNVQKMQYRSVAADHWCVVISLRLDAEWSDPDRVKTIAHLEAALPSHRHFVAAACRTSTGKIRNRSNFARFHREALIEFARQELAPAHDDYSLAFVSNAALTSAEVPGRDSAWDPISCFALTFPGDGYRDRTLGLNEFSSFAQAETMTTLRASLYGFQRAWRSSKDDAPSDKAMVHVHALLDGIRGRVAIGQVL